MKYSYKKVEDFPSHVKCCCYAILDNGYTMFPQDVQRLLNVGQKTDKTQQLKAKICDCRSGLRFEQEWDVGNNGMKFCPYCGRKLSAV